MLGVPIYDTLKIHLDTKTLLSMGELCIADKLEKIEEIDSKFGKLIKGEYKNLKIKVSKSGMIIEGSIHKLMQGFNITTFKLEEFNQAILQLSNDLKIDLMQGTIRRLDFSVNLQMDLKVEAYTSILISMPKYLKKEYVNSENITFYNDRSLIIFYDKVLDAKRQKLQIPIELKNKNILRVENRYLNRIDRSMNLTKPLLVSDIMEKDFYNQMILNLVDKYFKIKKSKNYIMDNPNNKMTSKELTESLAKFTFINMSQSERESYLKTLKISLPKREYYRFIDKTKEWLSDGVDFEVNKELDSKIMNVKKHIIE
jgi:hypothetical protein